MSECGKDAPNMYVWNGKTLYFCDEHVRGVVALCRAMEWPLSVTQVTGHKCSSQDVPQEEKS